MVFDNRIIVGFAMPPSDRLQNVCVCFLHGLDSSPEGTKGSLIKGAFPDAIIPELPPDLSKRLSMVEKAITRPVVLVGSSLGGLTALSYARRRPEMVRAMVLLAPAVGISFAGVSRDTDIMPEIPSGIPATIIAGERDEVIPLPGIRALYERSVDAHLVRFIIVDDDHNLHQSLDLMMQAIRYHIETIA